jgi:hypothetical protein
MKAVDVLIYTVVAIAGIILAIAIPAFMGIDRPQKRQTISYGVNGLTEVRCIDNYKFILSSNGETRQIMDSLGRGVKCDENVPQPQDEYAPQ